MFRSEVFEELSCAARMVKAAGHWRVVNQDENAAAAGSGAEGLGVPRREPVGVTRCTVATVGWTTETALSVVGR